MGGGVLLIGYDVEEMDPARNATRTFASSVMDVHSAFGAPCSMFVVGKTAEAYADVLRPLAGRPDLFDVECHTYSHVLLKTVCQFDGRDTTVFPSGSPARVRADLEKGLAALESALGVRAIGLTTPYGYYRGLSDRPDLLRLVHKQGIRFLRSYARDANDWQPVDLLVQPFWYAPQGFPEILEVPVHGWQDCLWRESHGWSDTRGFADYQCSLVDEAADRNLVLSLAYHDWSSVRGDPEMNIISEVLKHASERGVRVMSYSQYYESKRLDRI